MFLDSEQQILADQTADGQGISHLVCIHVPINRFPLDK